MSRRTLQRLAQVATAVSVVVILYATLAPPGLEPHIVPDWVAHLALFAGLGVHSALWYATSDAARRTPQRALVRVILTLWLFGGLTEAGQGFVAGRSPGLSDWAFDVAGAVVGFLAGGFVWRTLLTRWLR